METTRGIRAFGLFRALFGAWLLWTALPNLDHSFIENLPTQLEHFAETNPYPFYKWFLEDIALTNVSTLAIILSVGQFLVGCALLIGFMTQWVAFLGAIFAFSLFLSVGHLDVYHQGFCIVLLMVFATFVVGDAGQYYGLDRVLFRKTDSHKGGEIKFKNKKQKQAIEKLSKQVKHGSSKRRPTPIKG
jgi:uncharacterized membrane protein YphA (DoxX/SURF4 family)